MGETIKMTGLAEGQIRLVKLKPQFFLLQNHQQAEVVTDVRLNGITKCLLYFHEIGLIYLWTLYFGNVQTQAGERGRNTQWTLCPQPGFTKCPLCYCESVSSAATLLFYWGRWKWTPNTVKCEYNPHLKMRKIWLCYY